MWRPQIIPVMRSLLAPETVASEVSRTYPISPSGCSLQRSYTNDVYILEATTVAYVVKIYGPGWRTAADLAYEIDLLEHLVANGVAVAMPVPRRDGKFVHTLTMPEGIRYCVVFSYAPGTAPVEPFTSTLYYAFGRAAGLLHRVADSFVSQEPRFQLDLAYLLDRPLAAIRPHLAHRPDDWAYVAGLAERVHARISEFAAQGLDWGSCHGDLTLDCFHMSEDGQITFYDFDSGGPGWRALEFQGLYDAALYLKSDTWEVFRAGYTEVRPLGAIDLAAIPWCVPLYAIWSMGWAVSQWARWSGRWRADDAYWNEQLSWLPQWEAEQLAPR